MAFLPTMSLFLLAAINAAEEPVVAVEAVEAVEAEVKEAVEAVEEAVEAEVGEEEEEEEEEEEIVDGPAPGAFASCMEGTEWAAVDAQNGHKLTDSDTCESTFAFEECLTYPVDGKNCCPDVCNSEHICTGESFENVQDDVDEASNAVTECLENTYQPSSFAFWKWGATWRRTKTNTCEKVYAAGYTPETDISVALCCPNAVVSTEEPAAEDDAEAVEEVAAPEEPAAEDAAAVEEVAARMLAEVEAEAEAEAEGEAEAEAEGEEVEAEVFAPVPLYGQKLREMMCVGGPVTGAPTVTTDGSAPTDNKDKDKKDEDSSASTFGFTALALMLVTA